MMSYINDTKPMFLKETSILSKMDKVAKMGLIEEKKERKLSSML